MGLAGARTARTGSADAVRVTARFPGVPPFLILAAPRTSLPKIESIRPGDTLDATFGTYPLAELLLGILRGNLTGRLDVFLHPDDRNYLLFRDGVPLVVRLPDVGVSVLQILAHDGHLTPREGLEVAREAETAGTQVADVLRRRRRLGAAEVLRAEQKCARAQLVKLFDAGPVDFRFTEGALPAPEETFTILQSLPIVFQGLATGRDQTLVQRFVNTHHNTTFTLAATYPSGVDPFEWGPRVEAAVETLRAPATLADLEGAGLPREQAVAVLTTLQLTDMVDLRELPARPRSSSPSGGGARARAASPSGASIQATPAPAMSTPADGAWPDTQGLVIHRRGDLPDAVDGVIEPSRALAEPAPPTDAQVGGSEHDREYVVVRDRLSPYFGQNYFQILRVTRETNVAQLDRAYRFLVRRFEEEMDRPGTGPVLDLIHEAYEAIKDEESARRYGLLVERGDKLGRIDRERQAFEAEPKVDRAVRAMGSGRTGEATLLLSWAERLDPSRHDLSAFFGVLDVIRAPDGRRAADARAVRRVLQDQMAFRAHDWRIKMCLALVLAEDGEPAAAERLLVPAPDPSHPMVQRVRAAVARP